MSHQLVLVESPAKARKIHAIMRGVRSEVDWKVIATFGHFRDLPHDEFAIDVGKMFTPKWILTGQPKTRKTIVDLAKKADIIWLATDPDAEGEAISWHLTELLREKIPNLEAEVKRIEFNELTVRAITQAFENPRSLNGGRVEAAVARRLLDRLVGYSVSPMLQRDFGQRNLSAGRVQSVVLHWIAERDEEIRSFRAESFHQLQVELKTGEEDQTETWGTKRYPNKKAASGDRSWLLKSPNYNPTDSGEEQAERKPPPPFDTAGLIKAASTILGFASDRTMKAAQKLFEAGLITYHRTESVRPTWQFVMSARKHLTSIVDENVLTEKPKSYPQKGGHSAIHPTNVQTMSSQVNGTEDEKKVYRLIWVRSLLGQMKPAEVHTQTFRWIRKGEEILRYSRSGVVFPGWMLVSAGMFDNFHNQEGLREYDPIGEEDTQVEGVSIKLRSTEPPRPYTEAALISKMESEGVGRPSTYAATLVTLSRRDYARRFGKVIRVTPRGEMITAYLRANFPDLVRGSFTAGMEKLLDRAEQREINRTVILLKYWGWLKPSLRRCSTVVDDSPKCPQNQKHGEMEWVMHPKGSPSFKCTHRGCRGIQFVTVEGTRVLVFEPKEIDGVCTKCGEELLWLRQSKYGTYTRCDGCNEIQGKEPPKDKAA